MKLEIEVSCLYFFSPIYHAYKQYGVLQRHAYMKFLRCLQLAKGSLKLLAFPLLKTRDARNKMAMMQKKMMRQKKMRQKKMRQKKMRQKKPKNPTKKTTKNLKNPNPMNLKRLKNLRHLLSPKREIAVEKKLRQRRKRKASQGKGKGKACAQSQGKSQEPVKEQGKGKGKGKWKEDTREDPRRESVAVKEECCISPCAGGCWEEWCWQGCCKSYWPKGLYVHAHTCRIW